MKGVDPMQPEMAQISKSRLEQVLMLVKNVMCRLRAARRVDYFLGVAEIVSWRLEPNRG